MKRILLIALVVVALAALAFSQLKGKKTNPNLAAYKSGALYETSSYNMSNTVAARVAKLPAKELFQRTALVFIGTAKEAPEICKGVDGPCTGIAFTAIEVVAGKLDNRRIEFALPEGALPDGTLLKIAGAPEFISGERYLVFVRAGAWHLTPVTNWSHSVFREVEVGPQGQKAQTSLFVNEQGHVVIGLDDRGFQVAERIALPSNLLRTAVPTRGGARSGVVYNRPPAIDDKVKAALGSDDPKAIGQLGISKEVLVEAIARYAKTFGLNQTEKVQLRPSKSGAYDVQQKPVQTEPGLGKAIYEPSLPRSAVFPKKGRDREVESANEVEKPQSVRSSPGTEMTINGSQKAKRRQQ